MTAVTRARIRRPTHPMTQPPVFPHGGSRPADCRRSQSLWPGGSGSRVGLDVRKQLLKVAGRIIIEHSVAALHDCDEVDEIVVVMTPDFVPEVQPLLVRADLPKVTWVLPGGADERLDVGGSRGARRAGVQRPVPRRGGSAAVLPGRPGLRRGARDLRGRRRGDPLGRHRVRVDDDEQEVEIPDRSHLRRGRPRRGSACR